MKYAIIAVTMGAALPASAEIVAASSDHYTLRHEAVSTLSPEDMWERLIQPDTWWHPDHTYSGSAQNLWLNPNAGGPWMESWDGNVVEHGRVLSLIEGEMLRLDAPFGPLQGMAVNVVWTISIEPDGDGTRVIFEEIANGSSASGLDKIAPAVDGVKQQAMARLVDPGATN
ncbi:MULTISPECIES: SRPBCC family protein [Henriciella]|uniref:SRPBCC family protein n=1 Tax=Henriciella TaxID=453849 RepID=UPI0035159F06